MKTIRNLLLSATVLLGVASNVHGHATSIGYENAGPGSVNIWLGTYYHGGHHLEGSLNLVGVMGNTFPSTTVPFSMLTADDAKPAGLIDGVTNFFVQLSGGPLVGSDAELVGSGYAPNHWQGVNFTGLTPGSYQFTWTATDDASAEWSLWSDEMNGVFDLTGVVGPDPDPDPSGVPDGGSTVALLGGALAALGFAKRKSRR